jgi:hypothetical protein
MLHVQITHHLIVNREQIIVISLPQRLAFVTIQIESGIVDPGSWPK